MTQQQCRRRAFLSFDASESDFEAARMSAFTPMRPVDWTASAPVPGLKVAPGNLAAEPPREFSSSFFLLPTTTFG